MERRSAIKGLGGLLLLPALSYSTESLVNKPVLRIAHLTDIHLKNDLGAPGKYVKCLHHLQQLSPGVDFILNGGDIVFEMNKENISSINAQWALIDQIHRDELDLPVHYCLGNHDVWWNEKDRSQVYYGKRYSLERLGMVKPYNSFTKGGWKFITLDSTHLDIDDTWYIGKLGDVQYNWLKQELENTPEEMPVLIMSHIPILTALLMIQDNIVNRWEMLGGDMHTDTAKIINLFSAHSNVKLCLSGHLHMRDRVEYNKVTYLCNGAVSGAWWNGQRRETAPGYGLIDLYADGAFTEQYIAY